MKLSIKKPCQENFDEFTSTPSGGFCQSCQKEVIDFTQMTDAQVLQYFSQSQGNSCGRFQQSQLKSYPDILAPKSTWNARLMGASLLGISLFASLPFNTAQAQIQKMSPVVYIDQLEQNTEKNLGKDKEKLVVQGTVLGPVGEPLEGTSVLVKGTTNGMFAEAEGKFRLEGVEPGDILIFSYVGYERKYYTVPKNMPQSINMVLDINMEFSTCVIMGEVSVSQAYASKPSFWQRVKRTFR